MATSNPLYVRPVDIDTKTTQGKVIIKNNHLITELIHSSGEHGKGDALALLRKEAPGLTLQDISVDTEGRVVIDNEDCCAAIAGVIQGIASTGNGLCGIGCA